MKNQNRLAILHISLIDGVGPGAFDRINKNLADHHALDSLYDMSHNDLIELVGSEPIAKKLYAGLAHRSVLEQELSYIEQSGVSWVTLCDPEYPALLKNSTQPPLVLYWQGKLPQDIPL